MQPVVPLLFESAGSRSYHEHSRHARSTHAGVALPNPSAGRAFVRTGPNPASPVHNKVLRFPSSPTTTYCARTRVGHKRVNATLTARLVAHAIRFVASWSVLQCSDAWTLRTLLRAQVTKWGRENIFRFWSEIVDKICRKRSVG